VNKKDSQLGMNHGKASAILLRNILFNFVQKENIKCFHCNNDMTREDFTIEHIIPWLDSDTPTELFFNLDNITFAHSKCNYSIRRIYNKKTLEEKREQWANRPCRAYGRLQLRCPRFVYCTNTYQRRGRSVCRN